MKFETILKYHVQIMLLFVYTTTRKSFVIFTFRCFKLSWNTTALSQSNCRNFSSSSITIVIDYDWHFDCSLGSLRPKPRASPWYYQFIGRFKSLTTRSLGRFVGRMKGRNKVLKCARRARNMGYKAFALRNRGDCYASRYSRTYSGKVRMYGRFKASSGGLRSIDAYKIGKGIDSI